MMKKKIEEWPHHDYATRLSVAVVYAFLAAIAVNFFTSQDTFIPAELPVLRKSLQRCRIAWLASPYQYRLLYF